MVKSFRGKDVNMLSLFHKNEKKVALGNSKMNARGDLLGRNGVIIKTREEQIKEYQENIKKQEGEVSMKTPEATDELEKELMKSSKPEKIVPKKKIKKKEEEELVEQPEEEIVFDEE